MNAESQDRYAGQWTDFEQNLQRQPQIRFVAACDLQVRPIEWLIQGFFEADTLATLYGSPGKGKSFLALDISCCIAKGIPFHGHAVKRGAVFYIAGEGHNGIARRVRAWAQHHGTEMPEHLFISSAPSDLSNALATQELMEAVERLAKQHGVTPTLIVIDTMARNFAGDENSAMEVGNFVRNADCLRRQWNSTVLIVHHSGKDGEKGARGSSALKGAVDAEYEVTRSTDDGLIRLSARKMKDADAPPPLAFELVGTEVYDSTGAPVGSAALQSAEYSALVPYQKPRGPNQQKVLVVLNSMLEEEAAHQGLEPSKAQEVGVKNDEWRTRCEESGLERNRVKEACDGLEKRGVVMRDGEYVLMSELVRRSFSP